MKKSLYVITHKKLENKMPKGRKIMLVGAFDKQVPENYCSDFDENNENISNKNASFCELTGLYYFANHDDSEVLGLEHYRRFFVNDKFHFFKYHYLSESKIEKLLETHDVILPKMSSFDASVEKHYSANHYGEDLHWLREVIEEKYPDYLEDFDAVMQDNKSYLFNMIIGKASVVKDYASWLFDILLELEQRIDISQRDSYQKRVFGFLSERLMLVYMKHNKEIKIVEKPVLFLEHKCPLVNQFVRVWRKVKSIFKKK